MVYREVWPFGWTMKKKTLPQLGPWGRKHRWKRVVMQVDIHAWRTETHAGSLGFAEGALEHVYLGTVDGSEITWDGAKTL